MSSGYLENKPLHANLNLSNDADAGGSTIAILIYKYIVELKKKFSSWNTAGKQREIFK